jgi:hypothetical protein
MANNYILSYLGGCCGEWLSYQISKDENYYPLELEVQTTANKFVVKNPLSEFKLDIKSPYDATSLNISDEQRQSQDQKYNLKHTITPTHYMDRLDGINLARLRGVRLNFTHVTAPFFYTMLWIKTWAEPHKLTTAQRQDILRCANGDSGDTALLKIDNVLDRAEYVNSKDTFYAFEKSALRFGVRKSEDFVDRFYGFYFRYCLAKPYDFDNLSVENLMFKTDTQLDAWQNVFDTVKPLDKTVIEEYHANNIATIENTFNMTYTNYRNSKWVFMLKDWVIENCPLRY